MEITGRKYNSLISRIEYMLEILYFRKSELILGKFHNKFALFKPFKTVPMTKNLFDGHCLFFK